MLDSYRGMSQVIIVSNRLPVSVKKEKGHLKFSRSLGGLATGLASYVGDRKIIWIGWPGIASDDLTDEDKQIIIDRLAKDNYTPVWLTKRQIDEFYNGYSNSELWPVFHTLRHKSKLGETHKRWWQAYRTANQRYADTILNVSESDSRIWVHDYHLLLLPEMLRAERSDINIGFFLHIPFPKLKTLKKLHEYKKILRGILAADVIGFHTPIYVTNFLDVVQATGIAQIDTGQAQYEGRVVRVNDFPMGIDYEKYSSANKTQAVKAAAKKLGKQYKGKKRIVAVDRIDPSKGLVERLEAYRLFLARNPQQHGKIVFIMVAAPSRTDVPAYRNLAKRLKQSSDEINKKYGTPKWQPVDYRYEAISFEEVAGLFQIADIAFIAPLRDGMNLVAKEFVASANKNGALILSETAGASRELEDALLVNPRKPETQVAAIEKALSMRRRELRRRLKRMQNRLATYTVQDWAKDFVTALQQPVPGTPRLTRTMRERLRRRLITDYRQAGKRLLLLDYDGSLVPFREDYLAAEPPDKLLKTLTDLSKDPANDIVMISGRKYKDLEEWFGNQPLSLVAEHGASIKKLGNKNWQIIERPDTKWKHDIIPILEKYSALTPGSMIEIKPHTLVWHYRASPPFYAQKYAVTIKRVLKPLLRNYNLELMQGNKILEIKNPEISKGKAAQRWLKNNYDFILSLGDDATDEELFAVLTDDAYSIKVGRGRTKAQYRLQNHHEVNNLLKKLAKV